MTVVREVAARSSDLPGLAAGLVTVTAWGSAFVAIRAAADDFSPGALALGRLLVACLVLTAIALVRREPLPGRRDLVAIAVFGLLWLGVYNITLNAAEHRVDAGTAAMLINTGPILIAILAGIFLREGFPSRLFAGCALAFLGTVLIGVGSTSGGSSLLGVALCLLAASAYAVAVVVQKPVLVRVSSLQVTWLGCVAGTVACLPFAPTLASETADGAAAAVGWVLYLGLVPTALGFVTWAFALDRSSAGRMAALAYLIPVVAVVLGWAVLDEVPARLAIVGGGLCLVGVWLARRRA